MLKGLQSDERAVGEFGSPIRTTEIILDSSYCEKVINFLNDAKKDVRVCAYAWRWYTHEPEIPIQKLNIAILRARNRGVGVRCLVDTIPTLEMLRSLGLEARCVDSTRMMHTKAISIDDNTLILGSHNLTKRANTDNYEMSIVTQEAQCVLLYNDYFERMWLARG